MFNWIVLIAVIGAGLLVWVFWLAMKDSDDIYRKAGYPEKMRYFKDKAPPDGK